MGRNTLDDLDKVIAALLEHYDTVNKDETYEEIAHNLRVQIFEWLCAN